MQRNAIVSESLYGKSGYMKWSIQMKTYLLGQDVWDIVEADEPTATATDDDNGAREVEIKAWKKKNAVALHAIQISCSKPAFDLIQDISSAKIAWDTLADNYSKDEDSTEPESEFDDDDDDDSDSEESIPDFHKYESLLKAVHSGDWKAAKSFLAKDPEAVRARITISNQNALHVAVAAGHLHIVKELVKLMTKEDLLMKQMNGFTALAVAIERGNISIVECLIKMNKKLASIRANDRLPVVQAGSYFKPQMIPYLYSVTPLEDLTMLENRKQGSLLISQCVHWKLFDIALDLVEQCPHLAITPHAPMRSPLVDLSYSQVFASAGQLRFWQRWIYDRLHVPDCAKKHISIDVKNLDNNISDKGIAVISSGVFRRLVGVLGPLGHVVSARLLELLDVKHIYEVKLVQVQALDLLSHICKVIETTSDPKLITDAGVTEAMTQAVHNGNVEFIKSLAKANPYLVWTPYTAKIVFSLAIELRQEKVFSLIYGLHNKQEIISSCILTPPTLYKPIPGSPFIPQNVIAGSAAIEMQRHLQWYKEVDAIFPLKALDSWNKGYSKPYAFSRRDHKTLVYAGEKWMKDISSSCIVVGALIITIMFAAMFMVPRGNYNQDTSIPLLMTSKFSKTFIISDAVSLFSSTISVLMFLGILTSRYAEEDFLKSLPTKMIVGLSTLFFSILAMVVAFSAAFSIMLHEDSWIGSLVIFLASIPVTLSFMWMHFPLLVDIFRSTYGPSIFNRKVKPWL